MTIDTLSHSYRRRVNSLAVDRIDERDYQIVKLGSGEEDSVALVSDTNPLPVAIISGGGGSVGGEVELGATTLAALETINVRIADGAGNAITSKSTGSERPMSVAIVDGAGNQVTSFGGTGGTSATDDSAYTAGSGSGTPMMGFATADAVDSGDVGVIAMTTSRAMHVQVQNASIAVTDNGGSLTVDGSVSVTDGGGSITVDGSVTASLAAGTNNIGDVDVLTLPALPAGTNNIGDVDVLTLPALPTGANTIGSIASITTSVTPGTGAANLGKAEDAVHASGDTGVMALAVRQDADTSLVSASGDYAPLQVNSTGSLKVAITSGAGSGGTSIADGASFTRDSTSITPAGAVVESSAPTLVSGDVAGLSQDTSGNLRVRVAAGGITGVAEDAVATDGVEGVAVMAVRRDSATSGVSADGDYAMLSVTSDGSLRVSGGGGGTQYQVDAVAGATDTGTLGLAVRDDALATVTPADGDYTQLRVNARGAQWVCLDSTVAQTVTLAAGTATNEVVGDVAQDAAIAGNPVSIGLRASTAVPTAMSADGDAVYGWADRNGAVVVAGRIVDDAPFTPATDRVMPVGFLVDDTATDQLDEGDAGIPRITPGRNLRACLVADSTAGASAGHASFRSIDLDETEEEVKASGGRIFWIHCMNMAASVRYLKIYNNTAAGTTVGTTTPAMTFPIPTLATTNGAGFSIFFGSDGVSFNTGISVAATTGLADADTGAPGANEVVINLGYL